MSLAYRLLKQMVKENERCSLPLLRPRGVPQGHRIQLTRANCRNAMALYRHIDLIRGHLGCGMSCTVTLKEIFLNKRRLLTEVRPDLIDQVMSLLEDARDPRYIDFLLSICTADGGPMPAIQRLICEALVRSASRLLPIFSVSRTEAGFSVAITVPGTRLDPTTIHIDLANFDDSKQVMGRDFASHILTAPFGELSRTQKAFRYAVRCINLYGKLCVGRNQDALTFFLTSPAMPWKYDTLLELLREEKLPALLRARLTTLMLDLYVDRDPQTSKHQILYTRTW